jgi:hypothetical protein
MTMATLILDLCLESVSVIRAEILRFCFPSQLMCPCPNTVLGRGATIESRFQRDSAVDLTLKIPRLGFHTLRILHQCCLGYLSAGLLGLKTIARPGMRISAANL